MKHLCSVVQLIWLEEFASLLHSLHLRLPPWVHRLAKTLWRRRDWKLCVMTTGQFPAFSLPPFSCLVTPAVWVSRPPLLSSRDAGLHCLSFLIRLSLWVELGGRANVCVCGCVCVCVCVLGGVCVCVHMSMPLLCMHWDGWESVSGSMDVHVRLHCAIMWECGQFYSLCLR